MARPETKPIPEMLIDKEANVNYIVGKFLGKGGFAKCYQVVEMKTKNVYACKIVAKSLLVKQHQRDKMLQEISIHRNLEHENIVEFKSFFEDENFVYVILELCERRSLMELHKRRKSVTEPEARYFMKQIVEACHYLHSRRIIHRDLKLGNLFLNENLRVKIGDFGLATKVDFEGERKRTLCGTPNYIAPEVLDKNGHSFEVDVWSLGCILFTLLVGRPPFETKTLKDTYMKIKQNDYLVPAYVSSHARRLIIDMLKAKPNERPSMLGILRYEFFQLGFLPKNLPVSCLTMPPRLDVLQKATDETASRVLQTLQQRTSKKDTKVTAGGKENGNEPKSEANLKPDMNDNQMTFLEDLLKQLIKILQIKDIHDNNDIIDEEAQDPAALPIYWIGKWVDYSDKYGLGYQLCDNSVGVLFNDSTRIILLENEENIEYIDRLGSEHYHEMKSFPEELTKKVTLLKYFRNYMTEHLVKAGGNVARRESDQMVRLPFLRVWFRTHNAIVLYLSNGTVQVNFFQDHTKLILCPLMGAVTYINEQRHFNTYRFSLLEKCGCSKQLFSRVKYAKGLVERLISTKLRCIPGPKSDKK